MSTAEESDPYGTVVLGEGEPVVIFGPIVDELKRSGRMQGWCFLGDEDEDQ